MLRDQLPGGMVCPCFYNTDYRHDLQMTPDMTETQYLLDERAAIIADGCNYDG